MENKDGKDVYEKFENMRFSEFSQIFFNALTAMFAQSISSEQDARFAKILIDYIVNTIRNCSQLGLDNELMPIANFSLWQGAIQGDEIFFTFRKETTKSEKLKKLRDMMQETFNEWANKHLGKVVTADDVMENDELKWDLEEEGP